MDWLLDVAFKAGDVFYGLCKWTWLTFLAFGMYVMIKNLMAWMCGN